jgi:autotransporter-associated beta strand protein
MKTAFPRPPRLRRLRPLLLTAVVLALGLNLHAATWWWDGATSLANGASDNTTTTNQTWLSGGNWDNGATSATLSSWTAGDSAVFGGSAASQTISNGTLTIGNMTFGTGGDGSGTSGTAYTLTGAGITLSSGSIITNNTATTISGILAGTGGSLTKWGAAQLTLTAKNTYAGGTTVNQGTLAFGTDNSGSSYVGKGTLTINSGATATGTGGDNPLGHTANIIHSLVINGGTYTTVAAGGHWTDTITMTGGAINGTGRIDMQSYSGYTDRLTVNASPTPSTISVGTFALFAATTFNVAGGGTCIVSNIISGAGSLTKTGNGILALQGANSYTGATAVNGGTLLVNGSLASGSAVTVSGATLGGIGTVNGSASIGSTSVLAPGTASTLGTLRFNGTLTLNAASTNVLRIDRTSGVLSADKVSAASSGLAYNGTLVVVSNANSEPFQSGDKFTLFGKAGGSFTGSFASTNLPALPAGYLWDTSQLGVDGSIQVYAPSVVATPTFSPAGGGYVGAQSVTLSCATALATIYYTTNGSTPTAGSDVYSAAISVPLNTTLTIKAFAVKSGMTDSAVGSATYATLAAPFWVNAAGGSWAASGNWSNGVVGQGSSVTADFSQLTLPGTAGVTLDSAPVIGNLVFGDRGNTYGWTLGPGSGGPLTLAATNTPVIAVSNQTATISAVIAGTSGLAKNGNGTLVLSAANTFAGGTTVNAGTLVETAAASSGTDALTVNAGAKVSCQVGAYAQSQFAALNIIGGVFSVDGASQNQVNHVSKPVLMQGGTLTSTNGVAGPANDGGFGNFVVNGGTLTVSGTSQSLISATTFQVVNGGSFNVGVTGAGVDLRVASVINGGSVIKNGLGAMQLDGINTYTGATTVSNGTLIVNGSIGAGAVTVCSNATLRGTGTLGGPTTIQPGGTLAPGAALGALTINNTLTLSGTTAMDLDKGNATNNLVRGVTTLSYGGSLVLSNFSGTLARGDSFKLFNATTYTGTFSSISSSPSLGTGLNWWLDPAGSVWINGAPEASNFDMSVEQGGSNTVLIIGGKYAPTDADPGDTAHLTVTAVALNTPANGGALSITGGTNVTYTASNSFNGTDSFTYTVSDGRGGSVTRTVTVNVAPAGSGPNIVGLSGTVPSITVNAQGLPGALYSLQYTDSLSPVNWQEVGVTNTATGTGAITLLDAAAPVGTRFYRTKYISGP